MELWCSDIIYNFSPLSDVSQLFLGPLLTLKGGSAACSVSTPKKRTFDKQLAPSGIWVHTAFPFYQFVVARVASNFVQAKRSDEKIEKKELFSN